MLTSTAVATVCVVTLCGVGALLIRRAAHALPTSGVTPQYLAGVYDDVRIVDIVVYDDELLAALSAQSATLTAQTWWVRNDDPSRCRLERWRATAAPLRAYLSAEGSLMLADHVWGGNVACEPALSHQRAQVGAATSDDRGSRRAH